MTAIFQCDAYAPEIIELIVSGVDPKKACDELKLCSEKEGDHGNNSILIFSCYAYCEL